MKKLRELMQNNPMLGWGVAALLTLGAAFMLFTRLTAKNETAQLTEMVTLRDSETGETWKVPRGVMEKELWLRAHPLDPNMGMLNPKTGKPTGFPIDSWKETVESINIERSADAKAPPAKPAPPAGG